MASRRRNILFVNLVPLLLAAGLVSVHTGPALTDRVLHSTAADLKPFIRSHFVRPLEERELDYAAIRGMVHALGDRFSSFMVPEDAKAFQDETDSRFGGLGMEITVRGGRVTVIAPLEGTPAFRAGILPGDVIIEVDGEPCAFRSAQEAAKRLKGPPGTTIRLRVLHRGETSTNGHEVELERAIIRVLSVRGQTMEDAAAGIAYVRITHFSHKTARELRAAIDELTAKGARAWVLDLRNNPGGFLRAALETSDMFLAHGTILETRGRDRRRVFEASAEGTLPRRPLVVLINGASASAAEILSGALKDAGVAHLIGGRSYGKGSVQQVIRLADGAALRITTDYFHTRSGKRIQRRESDGPDDEWGIHPHEVVKLDPAALQRILFRRTEREYDGRNGHSEARGPAGGASEGSAASEAGAASEDPQLQAAIRYLRTELGR